MRKIRIAYHGSKKHTKIWKDLDFSSDSFDAKIICVNKATRAVKKEFKQSLDIYYIADQLKDNVVMCFTNYIIYGHKSLFIIKDTKQ